LTDSGGEVTQNAVFKAARNSTGYWYVPRETDD